MSYTGPDLLPRRFLCPLSLTPQVIAGSETSAAAAGACPTAPSAATTHPHAPMARHASRSLVTPILKDWPLDRAIPFASVVVSQLVSRYWHRH